MTNVILASRSPRRRQLLAKAGLRVRVIPSTVRESKISAPSAEHHAVALALAKAENVAKKLRSGLVIGADTLVVLGKKALGKPRNTKDAVRILSLLNNTRHYVCTAIAVIDAKTKKRIVDIDKTAIVTRKISSALIQKLARKNQDKAGAYAVQENADVLVKKIEGDFYTVVGLPLKKLKIILEIFSITIPAS